MQLQHGLVGGVREGQAPLPCKAFDLVGRLEVLPLCAVDQQRCHDIRGKRHYVGQHAQRLRDVPLGDRGLAELHHSTRRNFVAPPLHLQQLPRCGACLAALEEAFDDQGATAGRHLAGLFPL